MVVHVADWARGTLIAIGRNGSGPQEYLHPSSILPLRGDSSLLPNPRNRRWLLLSESSIVGAVGPGSPLLQMGAPTPLGADARGYVILTARMGGVASSAPRTDSLRLVRASRSTGLADSLTLLLARPSVAHIEGSADRPTSVSLVMNPLAAGEGAALFPDGWVAVARHAPYRVDWFAPDGRRIIGKPLPFDAVRIDEREKAAFLERLAARSGSAARDANTYAPWPDIVPPFLGEALLTAPDGHLWVRRAATADNADPPYDVIDRTGAIVARVAVGKDIHVVGFGLRTVFTVLTDDMGLQTLQR
jgi:hypothetical protein